MRIAGKMTIEKTDPSVRLIIYESLLKFMFSSTVQFGFNETKTVDEVDDTLAMKSRQGSTKSTKSKKSKESSSSEDSSDDSSSSSDSSSDSG